MDNRKEVEIALDFPVQLEGRKLERVIMRRPTVGDLLDNPIRDVNDLDGETRLFGKLCGLVTEDMRRLDMKDYHKIQNQYLLFRDSATEE